MATFRYPMLPHRYDLLDSSRKFVGNFDRYNVLPSSKTRSSVDDSQRISNTVLKKFCSRHVIGLILEVEYCVCSGHYDSQKF